MNGIKDKSHGLIQYVIMSNGKNCMGLVHGAVYTTYTQINTQEKHIFAVSTSFFYKTFVTVISIEFPSAVLSAASR